MVQERAGGPTDITILTTIVRAGEVADGDLLGRLNARLQPARQLDHDDVLDRALALEARGLVEAELVFRPTDAARAVVPPPAAAPRPLDDVLYDAAGGRAELPGELET